MDIKARERFADVVKNLRSGRDLRSFAKLVRVSHPTVLAWETCQSIPKRESLERIAELRGESLEDLLFYLEGKRTYPQERLFTAIAGSSKEQLVTLLRAIADRLEGM